MRCEVAERKEDKKEVFIGIRKRIKIFDRGVEENDTELVDI